MRVLIAAAAASSAMDHRNLLAQRQIWSAISRKTRRLRLILPG